MADIAVHEPVSDDHDGHGGHDDHADHGAHYTSTGLSNNKMAMWLFLGSECLLFGGLISTYMLYRGRHSADLGPDQIFDIPFTSVSSFVLLMSSLTMVLAVSAAVQKDDRRTNMWLTVTALLGATFVGGQVYEFTSFYREGLGFTTSLFSSSFFTLTGFHGVHVTVGIIMLMALVGHQQAQPRARRQGRSGRARRSLLALRRRRVDHHLHPRLPDPVLSEADMSTTADHVEHADHGDHADHAHEAHAHEHKPDSYYVKVALILAAITALETSTYWVDFGAFFLPTLLILMAIKFVMVASLFMHLKGDSKIFSYLFYTGLILAILVYMAFLATFRFFSPT